MAYDSYLTEADFGPLFSAVQTVQSVVNEKCEIDVHQNDGNDSGYDIILSRLKQGPISTVECESLVHRGQAFIGSLRRDGHVIHTKRVDGVSTYVYEKWEPVTKVTPLIKECYYKTPHWRSVSAARKAFDGFACVQCKSREALETHHLRYNLFEESIEFDLLTLCVSCHKLMHDAASGSSMHFPKTVTESEFLRIKECFPIEVSK